jgi:hypothetical protein
MHSQLSPTKYKLTDSISTDYDGVQKLFGVYHACKQQVNKTIELDFSELQWIDGNMCALLGAIVYKLHVENGLIFTAGGVSDGGKFDFLFSNGFLAYPDGSFKNSDDRKTTVPFKQFTSNEKDKFCEYINTSLMKHRGMQKMPSSEIKEQIAEDLLEILGNIEYHSKSTDPFFVCGQYYPNLGMLGFTIVDLGVGFLPAIEQKTNGEIKDSINAIKWALKGNSTKGDDCKGGIALRSIRRYCNENGGKMHIISGDAYYGTDLETTMWKGERILTQKFAGSIINLYFRC